MFHVRVLVATLLVLPALAQALPLDAAHATVGGNMKVVVIPLQFQDVKGVTPPLSMQNLFFAEGGDERSVRDFLRETTSGKVELGGVVVPQWITSSKLMGQYGNSESFGRTPALDPLLPPVPVCAMALEAAHLADPYVDYSQFVNPDGRVSIAILHAGTPEDWSGLDPDIWSQAWVGDGALCDEAWNTGPFTFDGARIGGFMTDSEFSPMGTNAHELGHSLFWLPDLYHAPNRVQGWDLMASGSWDGHTSAKPQDPHAVIPRGNDPSHFGAYLKSVMGWTTVQTASTTTSVYELAAAEKASGVRALRLDVQKNACGWIETRENGNWVGRAGERFFLVEYRDVHAGRYDGDSTASGIVLWYIDECANHGWWWQMNEDRGLGQRVRVVPSGTSYAYAALRGGATFSHLSTSSTTIDGVPTGWFVDVLSLGESATVRVGKAAIDASIVAPAKAVSVAAAGQSQGVVSAAYVTEAGLRAQPDQPALWSRTTPARISTSGGPSVSAFLEGDATHALACSGGATVTCAVPAEALPGLYTLRVLATDGSATRELTRPVTLV